MADFNIIHHRCSKFPHTTSNRVPRIQHNTYYDPSDPPTFYMHSLYDEQIDAKSLIIQLQLIHNFNLNIYMLWLCTNTDTYQPTCIIDDLIDRCTGSCLRRWYRLSMRRTTTTNRHYNWIRKVNHLFFGDHVYTMFYF